MTTTFGRGQKSGYRLWIVLVAIAVIPLTGAGWFATNEVVGARNERAQVADVNTAGQRVIALSELRTQLLDERNWYLAAAGIAELGLPSDLVIALTGIDVADELIGAAARVDDLVDAEGLDEVRVDLDEIRAADDVTLLEGGARYSELVDDIGQHADALLDQVLDQSGGVGDDGRLAHSLRVLEAATIARRAVAAETNYYFGAQFSNGADRSVEISALVGQATIRDQALAELDRIAPADSAVRTATDAIAASADAAAFDRAVTLLVQDSLAGAGADADLMRVFDDLQGVAATFEAWSDTNNLYLNLVDAAGQGAAAAGDLAAADAQGRLQQALASLIGLAVVSILVAVAATRAIARPVQRLGVAARELSAGISTPHLVVASGPIEVRAAARAINEASTHLELAARQALALAEGDLDHLSLQEPSPGNLGASLQSAVRTLAESLQEREELRQRMTHEATHDGLTQLSNRNASLGKLEDGLLRTAHSDRSIAVLFIDLDGFKEVNDHHGHHAGDTVLRTTARRLTDSVRDTDHVGRLGGDEFLVIAEPVNDQREAIVLAQRIHRALIAPIPIVDTEVTIGVSIGIALAAEDADNPEDLLRDADLAVYQAKDLGRDRIEICDDALKAQRLERAALEQAIHYGLMDDEFVLYYQPIVESGTEAIRSFEALIRWNRPEFGLAAPDSFVPFAERTDLITSIDRWVVRNIARQIVSWDADRQHADVAISVNISGRSLALPDFVNSVIGPLDEYGIDPARIIVEITETATLGDLSSTAHKLQELRQRGIRIAIDDFGTGYTSLAHLKTLPVDIIKIDRSFTNDESAASLVQLIIDTGHLLGATVIAEGIETHLQASVLSSMGSDELQGYLFGSPKPASELATPVHPAATIDPQPLSS